MSEEIIDELLAEAERSGGETSLGPFTEGEREEIRHDRHRLERARESLAGAETVLSRISLCWLNGRRAVRVLLTHDLDRHRERLVRELGADHVIVARARFTERELVAFQRQVMEASDLLAEEGIFISTHHGEPDAYRIRYVAVDFEQAEKTLEERFGVFAEFEYLGASRYAIRPQPFGSWLASGTNLHVFYALGRNGERPAGCTSLEFEDSVVVSVAIRDWRGAKTLIGGFIPSHCTIALSRPLGRRSVIDSSDNRIRPHWKVAAGAERRR